MPCRHSSTEQKLLTIGLNKMLEIAKSNRKQLTLLFFMGFAGILSILPILPQMLSLSPLEISFSVPIMQLITVLQSSILLLVMLLIGNYFSSRVELTAPLTRAIAESDNALKQLKYQIKPAVIGGVIGGIFILLFTQSMSSYLPSEFLAAGEKLILPWYSKLLYGGITEEILIRWGLMSFIVWCSYRITQKKDSEVKSYNYYLAIVLSALLFGILHLPAASMLSSELTISLVVYIIIGNGAFGLVAGFLFWKRGLECAIGAHMTAHILMNVAGVLFNT